MCFINVKQKTTTTTKKQYLDNKMYAILKMRIFQHCIEIIDEKWNIFFIIILKMSNERQKRTYQNLKKMNVLVNSLLFINEGGRNSPVGRVLSS